MPYGDGAPAMRARTAAVTVGVLALLAGCGKKSRLDQEIVVDACQLVSPAVAERLLGPLVDEPAPVAAGGGIAGNCTWRFKAMKGDEPARLDVMISTLGSAGHGIKPSRWFDVSQEEVRVSLGAAPWAMKDLGDVAYLYQTRRPDHAELWLRQSETVVVLRIFGGSAAQLEDFARALARELEPKKS
jgi:hypothetical protein